MTTMASPKPQAFDSAAIPADVQVIDSSEPLLTAVSSSAQVKDSNKSLVPRPTARVQVLDSNEPLVLPCLSSSGDLSAVAGPSVLAGLSGVAGPSGIARPSGMASHLMPASDDDEDDNDDRAEVSSPSGSSGRRVNPYSDEIRSMWNWRKVFSRLGTHDQCIQFAEERGLISTEKICSYHRRPMTLRRDVGQMGQFRCRKSNCSTTLVRASGTWFENVRLPLNLVFQIMYAFSEGLSYHQARKQLASEDGEVISSATVADWYNSCREAIVVYELEHQEDHTKIGGPNKGDQNKSKQLIEYSWRRKIRVHHRDPFEELIKAIKHVYPVK